MGHCKFDEESGCMLWQLKIPRTGYGQFSANGRTKPAHRWIYEYLHGPLPTWFQVDHVKEKCKHRHCVNPVHLEAVTALTNNERAGTYNHYRHKTHCKHGHKFDEDNTYYRPDGKGRECRKCHQARR